MSGLEDHYTQTLERPVGITENTWCRAVSCGTGMVVLGLQLSKEPRTLLFQNALHKLQISHPILRSKLHYNTSKSTYSLIIPSIPHLQVNTFSLSSTSKLLQSNANTCGNASNLSPFHMILEHELNNNTWSNPSLFPCTGVDVLYSSTYAFPGAKWVAVLRIHAGVCDRTTAVSLLSELNELVVQMEEEKVGTQREIVKKGDVSLAIEDLVPKGKAKKGFWAHGLDKLGYSVSSLRLTNLKFEDVNWPRCSQVVRLQLNRQHTDLITRGCKSQGIKLCGALAGAALIAAHSSGRFPDHQAKKYGVVTLTDCRSLLDPPLSAHHFGFYHSAIFNIQAVKGGETLWELARSSYIAFANYKKCNKHFSDMADLNYLMCKTIENPSLTASTSLRTSLVSVFEDPVIQNSSPMHQYLGLDDYVGCVSAHGVGPSIAIFDTIRDGKLDCACVYPSPLHSREQMQELVDHMKEILMDAIQCVDTLLGPKLIF